MARVRFRSDSSQIRVGEWADGEITYFGSTYDPESVDVLPPTEPSKVILVGRNLRDSIAELGIDPPPAPRLFFAPPSAVVGHGDTVTLPAGMENVVYGAELGVVVGRQCKSVSAADAESVIAGYTCVHDISLSDVGDVDPSKARVKGFDGAKPIGPAVVDPDRLPADARFRLRLNGEVVQETSTSEFLFTVPEILEEITTYFTLEPGDVIAMGSPAGNAPLSDGDEVAVEVDGIPTLSHRVRQ